MSIAKLKNFASEASLAEDPGSVPSAQIVALYLPVPPIPGDLMPSSDLHRDQVYMW